MAKRNSKTAAQQCRYYEVDNIFVYMVETYINGNFETFRRLYHELNKDARRDFMDFLLSEVEPTYWREILKQDEVAERVSKSSTAVTNSMRLLKLSDKVQQMIIDDMISTGHARALLAIDDPELQYTLANKIFDEKLSVRETEKLVKEIKNPKKPKEKKVMENAFIYQDLEEKMKGVFGTKVSIASKGKGKGKIEIEYYSDDELEHLFDMMMSIKRGE